MAIKGIKLNTDSILTISGSDIQYIIWDIRCTIFCVNKRMNCIRCIVASAYNYIRENEDFY